MCRSVHTLLTIILLIIVSCSGNNGNVKQTKLIPPKDLVSILTEIYIADGLLAYPPVKALFSAKDSVTNFIDIIERHGYTKERMDKTINHYFKSDPEKLEKIYDQVLARLSETEAKLKEPIRLASDNSFQLWPGEFSYSLPETGVTDRIWFEAPIKDTGTYQLDLYVILYSDDQSLNPRINIFFWHSDSTEEGARDYWYPAILPKDNQRHPYTLTKKLSDSSFTHIKGWLLDHDPQPGHWVKHGEADNISLRKVAEQ